VAPPVGERLHSHCAGASRHALTVDESVVEALESVSTVWVGEDKLRSTVRWQTERRASVDTTRIRGTRSMRTSAKDRDSSIVLTDEFVSGVTMDFKGADKVVGPNHDRSGGLEVVAKQQDHVAVVGSGFEGISWEDGRVASHVDVVGVSCKHEGNGNG
jgi:hypothetical protein